MIWLVALAPFVLLLGLLWLYEWGECLADRGRLPNWFYDVPPPEEESDA